MSAKNIRTEISKLIAQFKQKGRDAAEKDTVATGINDPEVLRDRFRHEAFGTLEPMLSDPTKTGVLVALAQEALVNQMMRGFKERLKH